MVSGLILHKQRPYLTLWPLLLTSPMTKLQQCCHLAMVGTLLPLVI